MGEINSTNVLDALVLVQTITKSTQTPYATACTLEQLLMWIRSHLHVQ